MPTEILPPVNNPHFFLLLGPSGVGKTTVIKELHQRDPRIQFVSPYTDRPNRPGETEKISITPQEFDDLVSLNYFVVTNEIYGFRYGTPRSRIEELLGSKSIPILYFPLARVGCLQDYQDVLFKIYITPPSLGVLQFRLNKDNRGEGNNRFQEGKTELASLVKTHFLHPDIDKVVVNKNTLSTTDQIQRIIYEVVS